MSEFDNNFHDDEDEGRDEWEDAMHECGQIPGTGCQLAGTEHCDFECPFREELYGGDDEECE